MSARHSVRQLISVAVLTLLSPIALADTIAIIGTGSVAQALGPEFAAQGHRVIYGSREPDRADVKVLVAQTGDDSAAMASADAVIDADIVVLAIPGMLVSEIVLGLGDLSDKIIIDPTNPLVRTETAFEFGVETSNGEMIQGLAPGAYVVKAFNTLSWRTMMDPASAGGPVTVPLAGDSDTAKRSVAGLVEGMGLEPMDVGGIENAHWVEGMLMLWINNRYASDRTAFDFHLREIPTTE